MLREEDEPVPEEEAHRLQVDRRAGHELAGLVPVVVAEREPEKVLVQGVAQVVFDCQCLPARDDPSPEHERSAYEAESDDREDRDHEHAGVLVAQKLVDDQARDDPDENACHLRPDGEDRGDGERGAIGSEEAQQADEGPPPGRRSVRGFLLACHGS